MENDLRKKILVIEDENHVRMSLKAYLEDHDYRVLEAEDGHTGLGAFRREAPDLILVDLRMPGVDGLEVLAAVNTESPDTPIIVVSGTGVIGDVVEALHLGAWDYVLKPIADMDVLLHSVRKALERSRLLLENRMHQEGLEKLVRDRTVELESEIEERRRVEEALKEQYDFLQTLMDAIPISVFFKDNHGIYLGCNDAYARFLGLKKEEIVGKGVQDVFPEELADAYLKADEALYARPGYQVYESKMDHADGTRHDVLFNKATYRDKNGEVSGLIGAMIDITKRRQTEEALKASERSYQEIFNSSNEAIIVFDVETAEILDVNRTMCEMFGCTHAEAVKQDAGHFSQGVPPYTMEEALGWARKTVEEGTQRLEWRAKRKNGELFWANVTLKIAVIRGRQRILVFITDISGQKEAETRLRESEKRYRAVVEDMPAMICRFTRDGLLSFVNDAYCKYFDRKPEELIGQNFFQFIPEAEKDRVRGHFMSLNQEVPIISYQHQGLLPNGSIRWMEWTDRALFDEKGRVVEFQSIGRDITDVRLAQEEKASIERQLQQAQKMEAIGTLAGGIAHDFNNILGAIIGYAEMIKIFDIPEGSPVNASLNEVLKAANRAKDLVSQILTFSRQSEQELKPIQFNYIIKEAIKFLRASLPTTIEIRQHIEDERIIAVADPTQIHQLVMNLCANAAHAMQETGGRLEVTLSGMDLDAQSAERFVDLNPGPHLKLTVKDNGHGMAPEVMERIFDPFFTTKKPGDGTGMGLAVVHGIVKSYGGVITVESELGKGTEFQIILPRIEMGVVETEVKAVPQMSNGTERILFVDDEDALTSIVQHVLARLGYEVTAKTSSRDALELFRAQPARFDLVITDQTMPYMTGLELAREMMKTRPDIPVILCTGYSDVATPERVKAAGIRELIIKPLNTAALAQTIRDVLDRIP